MIEKIFVFCDNFVILMWNIRRREHSFSGMDLCYRYEISIRFVLLTFVVINMKSLRDLECVKAFWDYNVVSDSPRRIGTTDMGYL